MIKKKSKRLQLKFKSYSQEALLLYKTFLLKSLVFLNIQHTKFDLPLRRKKLTLLKSPHVNKKAKEQFELKIYTAFISIEYHLSFIKYAFLNKPKAVFLIVKI
jgi:ribosomal protein S10